MSKQAKTMGGEAAMSSTKHTPEPWKTQDEDSSCPAVVADGVSVCDCWALESEFVEHATANANAARIVSCVNAMQGIDDPAAFRKCFEKLVQALEESIQYSPYKGESEETPFLRRARAALQSAKSLTKRGA